MIDTKVAKRYAKSLINLSNKQGVMDAVHVDLNMFVTVCKDNHDLGRMFSNPIVHSDKKLAVLKQIFAERTNKMTMTFFAIVIRKRREKFLIEIAKEFIFQYKFLKKIMTAEIISATGLDDKLRKQVYDLLRNDSNSEVELVEKINTKLIGGFILRIGDKRYDASIASELRKLAQAFSVNPYVKKN